MKQLSTRRPGLVGILEICRGWGRRGPGRILSIELSPIRREKKRISLVEGSGRICGMGRAPVVVPHADMFHGGGPGDGQVQGPPNVCLDV